MSQQNKPSTNVTQLAFFVLSKLTFFKISVWYVSQPLP